MQPAEASSWGVWPGLAQLNNNASRRSASSRPQAPRRIVVGLPEEPLIGGYQIKEEIKFTGKAPELVLLPPDAPHDDQEDLIRYLAERTVVLSGLGLSVNDIELREAAKRIGEVRAVRVFVKFWTGGPTGCGAIEFIKPSSVTLAKEKPETIFNALDDIAPVEQHKIVNATTDLIRRLFGSYGTIDPDKGHWSFGSWLSPDSITKICERTAAGLPFEEDDGNTQNIIPIEIPNFTPTAALAAVVAALDVLGEEVRQEETIEARSHRLDRVDLPQWRPLQPLPPVLINPSPNDFPPETFDQSDPVNDEQVPEKTQTTSNSRVLGKLGRWHKLQVQMQKKN